MSGLAGFVEFQAESCSTEENRTQRSVQMQRDKGILYEMGQKLQHRGRGQQGMYQSCGCNLMQCSAIATDKEEERQPLVRIFQGEEGVLALDGILWNAKELRLELNCHGIHLVGESDAELLLAGLMEYGIHYLKKVNGMFAFAWWQRRTGTLCLGRDHVGIRPLFYAVRGTKLVFASEMKALFAHPDVPPVINEQVMGQILAIGPAKIPGKGVFEGIEEVGAGSVLLADETGIRQQTYWQLENKPHTESYAQTVLHVLPGVLVAQSCLQAKASEVSVVLHVTGSDGVVVAVVHAHALVIDVAQVVLGVGVRETGRELGTEVQLVER